MISFDKIVNKMIKKGGKVVFKKDIFSLIDPEQKPEYQQRVNKIIYQLKAQKIIIAIKSGVYVIPSQEDKKLNKIDLIDKYYLVLLKKIITEHAGNQYFIAGKKSLELHLKNYSIPEKIYVVTRNVNKKISIGDYEVMFKTISGKSQGKKINLYSKLSSYTTVCSIEDTQFKIAGLELSLLESLLVQDIEGCDVGLVTKAIKKYKSVLNYDIFTDICQYKYIMSVNRLKELSKHVDINLYELCLETIKINGGLFVGEGLRNI